MKKNTFASNIFTAIFAASLLFFTACASKPQEEKPMSALELMKAGKTDQARSLFQIDTDINARDSDGNTLLHLCAALDDSGSIEYFLFKGADSEIKNKNEIIILIVHGKYFLKFSIFIFLLFSKIRFDINVSC